MFSKKNVKNMYALTPMQEAMLFHGLYEQESLAYFEQFYYRIHGQLDVTLFESSWNELIKRHDILRTIFIHKNVPQPLQIVLKNRKIDFFFKDIRSLSQEEQNNYCEQYQKQDQKKGFDLSKDMLMRLGVFRTKDNSFDIIWSHHHILMDGWSAGILYDELFVLYDSLLKQKRPDLKPPVPFSRYVQWLKKQDSAKAINFWEKYLSEYNTLTSVPVLNTHLNPSFASKEFKFKLNKDLTAKLTNIAVSNHVTINTVFQVLWGVLLSKYNDVDDVVFAATVSGRPADIKDIERMVGLFINTVPVRIKVKENQTFSMILEDVHNKDAQGKDFHYCQLADIQSKTPLGNNLFDHILIFENYPDLQAQDSEFEIENFGQFELTGFNLSLQIFPGQETEVHIIYNRKLYEDYIIENIENYFTSLLNMVSDNKECILKDIDIILPQEKEIYFKACKDRNREIVLNNQQTKRKTITSKYIAPENDEQEKICEIWKAILSKETIGIEDNFFELGGHSLKATRIVSRINKLFETEITIKDFFDNPNIKQLSILINDKDSEQYQPIENVKPQNFYDVSHSQKRLWILDRIAKLSHDNEFIAYNLSQAYHLKGNFNAQAFEKACAKLCLRHESLRTTFTQIQEDPKQVIHNSPLFVFNYIECHKQSDPINYAKDYAQKESNFSFDLEKGPLLRISLLNLCDNEYIILIVMHHIICDGWSFGIMAREVLLFYNSILNNNTQPSLSQLNIQYKDYAFWQNQNLEKQEDSKLFWHDKLSGNLPVLNLPLDYPRPSVQTYTGSSYHLAIDKRFYLDLQNYCSSHNVSLFMLFMASAYTLFYRYTGQDDIIIGTPISGRIHPDLEDQIGFFVNTLALREHIDGNNTFRDFLNNVKQNSIKAYDHQSYPFDKLVEELHLQRDISRSPIFDVMLVLQNNENIEWQVDNLETSSFEFEPGISQFDLTMIFMPDGDDLFFDINYNKDLFKEDTIKRFVGHFNELLKSILKDDSNIIGKLNIFTDLEKDEILNKFNGKVIDFPGKKTIVSQFEDQVQATPDNLALVFEKTQFTYRQLNQAANRLANYLNDNYKISSDNFIGVFMERTHWMIISLLAILKTRAAYLPIDPKYPDKRIKYMICDSGTSIILTDTNHKDKSLQFPDISVVDVTQVKSDQENNINKQIDEKNLAYVIYTSGSTGEPKGVMIEHAGFVNMALAQIKGFGISHTDHVLQFASPSFDASLSEIFMALLKGACLVMISVDTINDKDKFLQYIDDNNVSVITFPPVYLNMLDHHPMPTVKTIITAGEPAIIDDVKFYSKDKQYFNAYGPTETSVCTSFHKVEYNRDYGIRIPIGKPILNSLVYIIDEFDNFVPIGIPGEICFSGVGLARGYLNKPDKMSNFIENPFVSGERLYKIGDLCKWLDDGNIEFLGRKDDQVKIRGFRIEPGEIENSLREHPLIDEALVLPIYEQSCLAAYIITKSNIDINSLRGFINESLPVYMIPDFFITIEKFPLTPNGKIDKKALPLPSKDGQDSAYIAPQNPIEEKIVKVWQKLFNNSKISVYDNYFAFGGDSIKAIQMVSLLRQQDLSIGVSDIFRYPTIAQLATKIKNQTPLDYNQEAVTGNIPLTAISTWFFKEFKYDKHHFNHSQMFCFKERFNVKSLKESLKKIHCHHDALRMKYEFKDDGTVIQTGCDIDYPFYFKVNDLKDDISFELTIKDHINDIQKSIDLENGPLMKSVLFQLPDEDRLFITIHHLCIDGVSWRIFLEDLLKGYTQYLQDQTILLPSKTCSFKQWAQSIHDYAKTEKLLAEKKFWNNIESYNVKSIAPDNESDLNSMLFCREYEIGLSKSDTLTLLENIYKIEGADINSVLLTALAYAMKNWRGENQTLIVLEGHGREDIGKNIDISRTIGWFTNVYPVILELSDSQDLKYQIKTIYNILNKIPNKGIGYGILKYIAPDEYKKELQFKLKPQISFNFLGSFDDENISIPIKQISQDTESVSSKSEILYDFSFVAAVEQGSLKIVLEYNLKRYEESSIQIIMDNFKDKLLETVTYIQNH